MVNESHSLVIESHDSIHYDTMGRSKHTINRVILILSPQMSYNIIERKRVIPAMYVYICIQHTCSMHLEYVITLRIMLGVVTV